MMRGGIIASAHVDAAFTDASFARYNFDEGSGATTADRSGNGYTMAASGTPWDISGHTGGGLAPTTSNYFSATLGTGQTSQWTIMLWYRCDGAPSGYGQFVFDISDMSGNNDSLWTDINSARQWGTYPNYSADPLAIGQWYHLTWTSDGTTVRCYQDGVQVAAVDETLTLKREGTIAIGKGYDGPPVGIIDDVRFFDITVASADIPVYMAQPVV